MARNKEKQFCNLNRLILLQEKEEYEKAHPPRPRLNTLDTPEDIQKWLPSIKRDIDFYLKKSQVTCYSEAHINECREKVVKLEKEFKAFVRKIKKLAPSPSDVIPWTSRPYKRRKTSTVEETPINEFKRIATPILDEEKNSSLSVSNDDSVSPPRHTEENNSLKEDTVSQYEKVNWNLMNQPLFFSSVSNNDQESEEIPKTNVNLNTSYFETKSCDLQNSDTNLTECVKRTPQMKNLTFSEMSQHQEANQGGNIFHKIVNYDSSDEENS